MSPSPRTSQCGVLRRSRSNLYSLVTITEHLLRTVQEGKVREKFVRTYLTPCTLIKLSQHTKDVFLILLLSNAARFGRVLVCEKVFTQAPADTGSDSFLHFSPASESSTRVEQISWRSSRTSAVWGRFRENRFTHVCVSQQESQRDCHNLAEAPSQAESDSPPSCGHTD